MNNNIMRLSALFKMKMKSTFYSRQQVLTLLLLPVVALLCLWAALTFYAEGDLQIPVGVVDLDQSEFSVDMIRRMAENKSVRLIPTEENTGRELLRNGTLEAVFIISDGFSERISDGNPDALITLVSPPSSISGNLVTELLTAQVSRLYFAGDAASTAQKERRALNNEKDEEDKNQSLPSPGSNEQTDFWNEAFQYANSFWEPTPLMSIHFEVLSGYDDSSIADNNALETKNHADGAKEKIIFKNSLDNGTDDAVGLMNFLLLKSLSAAFFTYVVFCILSCSGTIITERDSGITTRILACRISIRTWLSITAMVPFILFGLPAAVLYAVLLAPESFLTTLFTLLFFSVFGVALAYRVKSPLTWRIINLILISACFLLFLAADFIPFLSTISPSLF